MEPDTGSIRLLQFMICEKFEPLKNDGYRVEGVRSNLHVPSFPAVLSDYYLVTCWRKDERFHKEVIEYAVDGGPPLKTPPMDIEPVRDHVIFRWHKHRFPENLRIEKPCTLWIRVALDWNVCLESYLLIEQNV
ncbi:MAG: hypothetical protein ACOY3K_01310 [Candidatus Omnitrophota bacterium]